MIITQVPVDGLIHDCPVHDVLAISHEQNCVRKYYGYKIFTQRHCGCFIIVQSTEAGTNENKASHSKVRALITMHDMLIMTDDYQLEN